MDQLDLGAPSMWTSPPLSDASFGAASAIDDGGAGISGQQMKAGSASDAGAVKGYASAINTSPTPVDAVYPPSLLVDNDSQPYAGSATPSNKLKRLSLVPGFSLSNRQSLDAAHPISDTQSKSGSVPIRPCPTAATSPQLATDESEHRSPSTRSHLASPRRLVQGHARRQSSISYSPSTRQRTHHQSLRPDVPNSPLASAVIPGRAIYKSQAAAITGPIGLGLGEVNTLDRNAPVRIADASSSGVKEGRGTAEVKQARRQSMATMGYGAHGRSGVEKGHFELIEEKEGKVAGGGVTLTEQHADLLTLIAQKERRVNELRRELIEHESALKELKESWTALFTHPSHSQPGLSTTVSRHGSSGSMQMSPRQAQTRHPLSSHSNRHRRPLSMSLMSASASISSTSSSSTTSDTTLATLPEALETPNATMSTPSPPLGMNRDAPTPMPIRIASALDDIAEQSLSSLSQLLSTAAEYSVGSGAGSGGGMFDGDPGVDAREGQGQGVGAAEAAVAALEGGKRFWGTLLRTVGAAAGGSVPEHTSDGGVALKVEAGEGGQQDRGDNPTTKHARRISRSELQNRQARPTPLPPTNVRRLSTVQMHRPPLPRQLSLDRQANVTSRNGTSQAPLELLNGQTVTADGVRFADGPLVSEGKSPGETFRHSRSAGNGDAGAVDATTNPADHTPSQAHRETDSVSRKGGRTASDSSTRVRKGASEAESEEDEWGW